MDSFPSICSSPSFLRVLSSECVLPLPSAQPSHTLLTTSFPVLPVPCLFSSPSSPLEDKVDLSLTPYVALCRFVCVWFALSFFCGCLLFDLRVCWWSVGTIGLVLDCAWVCVVGCVASGMSTVHCWWRGGVGWAGGWLVCYRGQAVRYVSVPGAPGWSVRTNPEPGPMTLMVRSRGRYVRRGVPTTHSRRGRTI